MASDFDKALEKAEENLERLRHPNRDNQACLLCEKRFMVMTFIAHTSKKFFICKTCLAELLRYIQN